MPELIDAHIPNGELAFFNEVPEVAATSETTGNVTINNMGSPGLPSYFEVTFRANATYKPGGIETSFYFSPSIVVTGKTKDSTFREVESEAAREIAPMLRAIADKIAQQVAEYDAKQDAKALSA